MARHHRHAVQPAAPAAGAPAPPADGAGAAAEPGPVPLKWRVALLVWALGLGGLALYELVGFAVRAVRSAVS